MTKQYFKIRMFQMQFKVLKKNKNKKNLFNDCVKCRINQKQNNNMKMKIIKMHYSFDLLPA